MAPYLFLSLHRPLGHPQRPGDAGVRTGPAPSAKPSRFPRRQRRERIRLPLYRHRAPRLDDRVRRRTPARATRSHRVQESVTSMIGLEQVADPVAVLQQVKCVLHSICARAPGGGGGWGGGWGGGGHDGICGNRAVDHLCRIGAPGLVGWRIRISTSTRSGRILLNLVAGAGVPALPVPLQPRPAHSRQPFPHGSITSSSAMTTTCPSHRHSQSSQLHPTPHRLTCTIYPPGYN